MLGSYGPKARARARAEDRARQSAAPRTLADRHCVKPHSTTPYIDMRIGNSHKPPPVSASATISSRIRCRPPPLLNINWAQARYARFGLVPLPSSVKRQVFYVVVTAYTNHKVGSRLLVHRSSIILSYYYYSIDPVLELTIAAKHPHTCLIGKFHHIPRDMDPA